MYTKHIKSLNRFYAMSLRKIAAIKWQDFAPSTEILRVCNVNGIKTFLLSAQFRLFGRLVRMQDERIPKSVFCGEIKEGVRSKRGPKKRVKDSLKANLTSCNINSQLWEISTGVDRPL